MTATRSPVAAGEDSLLDRILAADSTVVALHCDDITALGGYLRKLAMDSGYALYLWRAHAGLRRLLERDETVSGMDALAAVLRFISDGDANMEAFFVADIPDKWSPDLLALLRRVANIDPHTSRRLVLLTARAGLPSGLPVVRELLWGCRCGTQPRLRDGKWVR